VMGLSKIGSCELFAQSWFQTEILLMSVPPKQLGLQAWATSAWLALLIFEIGFHFMPKLWFSYLCFLVWLGMTGTHKCAQLLVEMGVLQTFFGAGLKLWSLHPK
jgi:hypothetical protein